MPKPQLKKKLVNHIKFVLDKSSSMKQHEATVIKVAQQIVEALAAEAKHADANKAAQETRVSIYAFADEVECLVWDTDALRLPSIADIYAAHGNTALMDGTMQAITDGLEIPTKYGDHSFLIYVITDGEENASKRYSAEALSHQLAILPENWTVGAMVPGIKGIAQAKKYGFSAGNIQVWDASSQQGAEEAGQMILNTVSAYTDNRAKGIRGTRNLFNMNTANVSTATVKALNVAPMAKGSFKLIPVVSRGGKDAKIVLKEFITDECGLPFRLGKNFYQLSKVEKIQGDKALALVHKKTNEVYVGYEVREFLGLPDHEVKVGPEKLPEYDIFVQSNSNNRHLVYGTKLLVQLT